MVDNDTKVQTKGLRASNTNTTLAPKSIFDTAGEPMAFTPNFEEEVLSKTTPEQRERFSRALDEVDKKRETIFQPERFAREVKEDQLGPKVEATRPFVAPLPPKFSSIGAPMGGANTVKPDPKTLQDRVTRLEEQVDGLLERLARFNFKASHKI